MNAQTWARTFRARLLEPGLVSYEDSGCGVALLQKSTIDRCINSFIGRPVTVRHTKTSPQNMKEVGHGYVTGVEYDPADGWWYGIGIVDTDEAATAIKKWGFGSVGYVVNGNPGPKGEYHAIPYDEEILSFSGEHLAIVDRPRYEGATIRLNAKTKSNTTMFKWIKKVASRSNAPEPTADEVKAAALALKNKQDAEVKARENAAAAEDITGETELEIPTRENGKTATVKLADLVEAYNAREDGVDPASEIEIDGKPVAISALVESFKANAKDDADEDEKKKEKENAEAKPAVKKGTHFRVLMNASKNGSTEQMPTLSPDSLHDRVNRGAAKYGSAVKN